MISGSELEHGIGMTTWLIMTSEEKIDSNKDGYSD
jgi:hypothetical protein